MLVVLVVLSYLIGFLSLSLIQYAVTKGKKWLPYKPSYIITWIFSPIIVCILVVLVILYAINHTLNLIFKKNTIDK